jgi:hypothetical protein
LVANWRDPRVRVRRDKGLSCSLPSHKNCGDDSTVGDHFWLAGSDQCYYIWEYTARKGYGFSPANNFVWNLKIKPSAIDKSPLRYRKVLASAFHGWNADVRDMLSLKHSTPADHESAERLAFDELLGITELKGSLDSAPRPVIVIVDDVLNSGKHFKVAQSLIRDRYPSAEIRGVFLARCAREAGT